MYTDGTDILTLRDLKAKFPNTSFTASGPSAEWMAENGIYPLTTQPSPIGLSNQIAFRDGVEEIKGEWRVKWSFRDMTAEELEDRAESFNADLSDYRDQKWSEYGIELTNGAPMESNQETLSHVNDTIGGLIDNESSAPSTVNWKCADDVFREVSISDLQEYRSKHRVIRQAAFDAEKYILESGPYADDSWKVDFDTYFEGELS